MIATIDEALAFLSGFHDAYVRACIADDAEVSSEAPRESPRTWWAALLPYFWDMNPVLNYGHRVGADGRQVLLVAAPPVFLVHEYQHKTRGQAFQVFVGDHKPDASTYKYCVHVKPIEGHGLRIVAQTLACFVCRTTGQLNLRSPPFNARRFQLGDRCPECKGSGWLRQPREAPGALVEVRTLMAPADPDHLAHYEQAAQNL
ncbi:MAG: hypothetical protein K8W52_30070 [Deltaproteobacteria bacterium]|nr:hypothetical protein [Deltaproteobacteria bacterium]